MMTTGRTETRSLSSGRILEEAAAILAITLLFLYVSEAFFGGATFVGGLLGWLGLVFGMLLVWLSLQRRGQTWASIGLGRPESFVRTSVMALGVAVAVFVMLQVLLQLIILPVFGAPDSSRFARIAGNRLLLAGGLFSVWTAAAFGEEIIFRGYLVSRLAELLGEARWAWVGAVVTQSLVFGVMHFYQGLSGIVITGVVGLLFGFAYLAVRRNLWVLVLAHGFIDTFSLVTIYSSG